MELKTAFLYDFLQVPGGAEQVALHLARVFPDMDCTCAFVEAGVFPQPSVNAERFRTLTSPTGIVGWQSIKAIRAFERKTGFLKDFDAVIYSGLYAPVAIRNQGSGVSCYYCHTPPRFVYDLRDYYLEMARPWQKPLLKALIRHVQPRYESAIRAMDVVLANSQNVKQRLERYLGLDSVEVLNPPVDTQGYRWTVQEDFYLSTARLEPYKRVDLVVKAFTRMPERNLVVASGGSELQRLQSLAEGHANIRFTGWCSQDQMKDLVGRCIATLYLARDEDFGMSPVESLAAGKPVIGAGEGGLLETVSDDITGLLIEPDKLDIGGQAGEEGAVAAVIEAVRRLDRSRAIDMRADCERSAANFDSRKFDARIAEIIGG